MAERFRLVSWTPFKRRYDAWMALGIALYLVVFTKISASSQAVGESFTPVQLAIRATGSLAFVMLTLTLCIGPLARLWPGAIVFLYNRRHLGVTTFIFSTLHVLLSVVWYHGFAATNPLASIFTSNMRYNSFVGFPFEVLGVAAFLILLPMAATSHDVWNRRLGPRAWKSLHMMVYAAYGLLVGHVALGIIQFETHPLYAGLLAAGATLVGGLHLLSAIAVRAPVSAMMRDGWLAAGRADDIPDGRARILTPPKGERIAVFRNGDRLSAVTNHCAHQGGPLGEGRLVDGCITCPWHGWQYDVETGRAPPPFTERVATYQVRIAHGMVFVSPTPNPPDRPSPPANMTDEADR